MRDTKKYSLVVQSNKLIEARYSLTVGEQRLILAMVSMIHPDDADFFDYEISMKDLSGLLNIDITNIYREVDKITERLMERILHIVKPDGYLLKAHWVSTAEYRQGTVVLSFSPKLKPYLLDLKREFTKFDLSIATQFKSIYSIRIYQLLKQYKGIGYREFSVDVLKEILGIKKEEYKEFKRFRGRVLSQAKKEFEKKDESGNCKCDLTFKLETIREGRRIAKLKFIIIPQEYKKLIVPPDVVDQKKEDPKPQAPQSVKDRLVYYGISEKQSSGFLDQMQEADIEDVLVYYAGLLESGQVKNTGGAYLVKLLRDGITVKSSYEKEQEATRAMQAKQEELQRQQEELSQKKTAADERSKKIRLQEKFDSLTAAEKEELLTDFEASLDRLMLKFYQKDGVQSVVVRSTFFSFLDGKLS